MANAVARRMHHQHLCKKKGDAEVCDNSRGILLADHSGKALAGLVKCAVGPQYDANQPDNQHAAPKKGTDIARLNLAVAREVPGLSDKCAIFRRRGPPSFLAVVLFAKKLIYKTDIHSNYKY